MESPSSLERLRSALRLLHGIGISSEHWRTLQIQIHEQDEEFVVGASKLGIGMASKEDRITIAQRLIEFLSSAPWYLQEDIENLVVALKKECARKIEDEIAHRMKQPEGIRARDNRLRVLLRVKRRIEQA